MTLTPEHMEAAARLISAWLSGYEWPIPIDTNERLALEGRIAEAIAAAERRGLQTAANRLCTGCAEGIPAEQFSDFLVHFRGSIFTRCAAAALLTAQEPPQ